MKTFDITALPIGTVARDDYYSDRGELLLSKGTVIEARHIGILQRRNILEVYVREFEGDGDIERIVNRDFTVPAAHLLAETAAAAPSDIPVAGPLPAELRGIRSGREGLAQLTHSRRALEVEKSLEIWLRSDMADGTPLSAAFRPARPQERPGAWKNATSALYAEVLREVRTHMTHLIQDATAIDGSVIRNLVERFVKVLASDHNLLLHMAYSKPTGEEYLFTHALNVCLLSLYIAAVSGYSERQVCDIGMAALLHDTGMFLVPTAIRFKKGKLTDDEMFEIQKHPILGLHLLERIHRLPETVPIVAYQSHEREDGSGYPRRRNSRLIHRYSKIVHLADIYEALSSPRPYRAPLPPFRCMETLMTMMREGLLSAPFLKSFLTSASLFPVGTFVELSDGRIGRVTAANGASYARPVVSILRDGQGRRLQGGEVYQVDLNKENGLRVIRSHAADSLAGVDPMEGF